MNYKQLEIFRRFTVGELDRRSFVSRLVGLAGGTAAATAVLPGLTTAALAQPGAGEAPSGLSLAERDRRHAVSRQLMEELGLDALLIPGNAGGVGQPLYAYWFSDMRSRNPWAVILPRDGEPVVLGAGAGGPGGLGGPAWITQGGRRGPPLSDWLVDTFRELDLSNASIGTIGVEPNTFGLNEFSDQGLMLYSVYSSLLENLPRAEFVDVTGRLTEIMLVKSAEEIPHYEAAAAVGEGLHRLMVDMARPGVSPLDYRAEIAKYFVLNRAEPDVQALQMSRRRIASGDVINSEYGITHGSAYVQVTLCIAVGEVSRQTEDLAAIAHECYQIGMDELRPGRTFREVIEPMEKVIADAGYWHGFPVLHSVRPVSLVGPVGMGPPPAGYAETLGGDVEIRAGMPISFEPGARVGPQAQVKVGGMSFVRDDGVYMMNTLGTSLRRV